MFDLAAGKFPQPGHRLVLWPLRDQHTAICINEGASRNENDFGSHGMSAPRVFKTDSHH